MAIRKKFLQRDRLRGIGKKGDLFRGLSLSLLDFSSILLKEVIHQGPLKGFTSKEILVLPAKKKGYFYFFFYIVKKRGGGIRVLF